jgi:cytoskeleton protein RodZ
VAQTRIAKFHLEAIENGHFDSLPGGAYRSSFLRQYARALDLDEIEVLASFHQQYQEPALPLPKPPPSHKRSVLGLLWVPVAAAGLLGIYSLWQTEMSALSPIGRKTASGDPAVEGESNPAVADSPAPAARAPAASTPASAPPATPPPSGSTTASSGPTVPPRSSPGPVTAEAAASSSKPPLAGPAAPTPAKEPGQADRTQDTTPEKSGGESASPPAGAAIHVSLSSTEPVWIRVVCDGVEVFSGTIARSQLKQFEASTRMTTLVGNAAGLTYSVNGKTYGPTGAPGEIQLLEFTPYGARVLTRRPPTKPATQRAPQTPQGVQPSSQEAPRSEVPSPPQQAPQTEQAPQTPRETPPPTR